MIFTSDMENEVSSMPDIREIRAGLIRNGFKSLRAWSRRRDANYNTAWAALNGRRSGTISLRVLALMRKDARV